MKQVEIIGPKQVSIRDVKKPESKENWAVVKIVSAPMCTEYKQYESGKVEHPLGHEAAGEVVEIGNSHRLKVGDRVVVMPQYPCGNCTHCNSGEYIHCENIIDVTQFTGSKYGTSTYAEYLIKPDWLLPKIPENISYDHASMLCCGLGPAFGAMERMNVNAHDTVLITGLGPVGLGAVINAKYRGCKVFGVTKNQYRADLAVELGAEKIFDPRNEYVADKIKEYTGEEGVSIGIDCAGNDEAQRILIDASKRNGKVAFVGEAGEISLNVSDDLLRKGLTLFGIWHYNYSGIEKLFQLVKDVPTQIEKLITHRFHLDDVEKAWDIQITRKCGKVILKP